MHELIFKWYAIIFARTSFQKLNFLLLRLGMRGLGILNYKDFKVSGESFFINYLRKNYKLQTIFDVGANKGNYTQIFKELNCQIHSFEPHPKTAAVLKKRFELVPNVKVHDFGLSDQNTEAVIYDYAQNDGSSHASVFQEVIEELHHAGATATQIQLKTLDSVVESENLNHISLLKIDTEGNELNVLRGAQKTLKAFKVDIIHFEFNEMNTVSRVFLKDFIQLLSGYNFYRLLPNGFLPIHYNDTNQWQYEIFAYQNIVAFKKDKDKLQTAD